MQIYKIAFILFFLTLYKISCAKSCFPVLWPSNSAIVDQSVPLPADWIHLLELSAKKMLLHPSHPIPILSSAGKINKDDPDLIATRVALLEPSRASILALTYRLTRNPIYLRKARSILLDWSQVNQPTGHPIDETKLDEMIWAYDLIACDLSEKEKKPILNWFKALQKKKISWQFGKKSTNNNHRIHQLKMLILLDKVLQNDSRLKTDTAQAHYFSCVNINPETGISIDYLQRNALYYHNYVLQPWLEISLITQCCQKPIKRAFTFLRQKILSHHIEHEFLNSENKLDQLRAEHGFKYAQGLFDTTKASPTIIAYYTVFKEKPDLKLWQMVEHTALSPHMIFLKARRQLWQP